MFVLQKYLIKSHLFFTFSLLRFVVGFSSVNMKLQQLKLVLPAVKKLLKVSANIWKKLRVLYGIY